MSRTPQRIIILAVVLILSAFVPVAIEHLTGDTAVAVVVGYPICLITGYLAGRTWSL